MKAMNRIHFEDGPEDGLVIPHALLVRLHSDTGKVGAEVPLYLDPDGGPGQASAYLLGRYRLGKVKDGTATYRWQPA